MIIHLASIIRHALLQNVEECLHAMHKMCVTVYTVQGAQYSAHGILYSALEYVWGSIEEEKIMVHFALVPFKEQGIFKLQYIRSQQVTWVPLWIPLTPLNTFGRRTKLTLYFVSKLVF